MKAKRANNSNAPGDFFQIKALGSGGGDIYVEDSDYRHFVSLMDKYLTNNDSVKALAYCLAPDHFNMLLSQDKMYGIEKLLHNLIVGYNAYFYNKYKIEDVLLEVSYDAKVVSPNDLLKVSSNIHKKTDDWADCEYSSIRAYLYDDAPNWLEKYQISNIYGSAVKYFETVKNA